MPAKVHISANKAIISGASGNFRSATIKANADVLQLVTIRVDETDFRFTGMGEADKIIGSTQLPDSFDKIEVTSEFVDGQKARPSVELRNMGFSSLGAGGKLVIVAENGDDESFDDTIIEFHA
ncbi:hypothetical protein HIM_06647 [Hirsutella minnesotensis 3608]|uniref:Calcium-mediated lectin domain-containing protein n=1 Tax=Hirsutella minnesotensis 3608 TaxID=1043627 RepID=A0A0F8A4Q3_9HYPO|nr:hypothetical protein HIM_06647 [Hirsutella minnesotensis 3608]